MYIQNQNENMQFFVIFLIRPAVSLILIKNKLHSTFIVVFIQTLKHVDTRKWAYLRVFNNSQNNIHRSIAQSKYKNLMRSIR